MARRMAASLAFYVATGAALSGVASAQGVPFPPQNRAAQDARRVAEAPPIPPGLVGGGRNERVNERRPNAPARQDAPARQEAPRQDAGGVENKKALIDKLNAYLSNTQSLIGDFVQIGPDGSKTDGKFYLQKPGKVRFEYNPPSVIELIADGTSVAIRDRKLATQDLYLLSQTPLKHLLAEKINLQKDVNLVAVTADDTFVTATIEEKQTLGGNYKVVLMFGAQDYRLRQWTITDAQGFDTTVALYNLDSSKKPDPNLFKINYERMIQ